MALQPFTSSATASVNVDTTVGGATLTASLSGGRTYIEVWVPTAETDTLYLSTGTPTSTDHFIALTGGQGWGGYLGRGITLKGLSSSGTIAVKVLECIR